MSNLKKALTFLIILIGLKHSLVIAVVPAQYVEFTGRLNQISREAYKLYTQPAFQLGTTPKDRAQNLLKIVNKAEEILVCALNQWVITRNAFLLVDRESPLQLAKFKPRDNMNQLQIEELDQFYQEWLLNEYLFDCHDQASGANQVVTVRYLLKSIRMVSLRKFINDGLEESEEHSLATLIKVVKNLRTYAMQIFSTELKKERINLELFGQFQSCFLQAQSILKQRTEIAVDLASGYMTDLSNILDLLKHSQIQDSDLAPSMAIAA